MGNAIIVTLATKKNLVVTFSIMFAFAGFVLGEASGSNNDASVVKHRETLIRNLSCEEGDLANNISLLLEEAMKESDPYRFIRGDDFIFKFDQLLYRLSEIKQKHPALEKDIERILLSWNYCELYDYIDGSVYFKNKKGTSFHIKEDFSTKSGFGYWGFFTEDSYAISPNILVDITIGRRAYHSFFNRTFHSQCFPHPDTYKTAKEMYADQSSFRDLYHRPERLKEAVWVKNAFECVSENPTSVQNNNSFYPETDLLALKRKKETEEKEKQRKLEEEKKAAEFRFLARKRELERKLDFERKKREAEERRERERIIREKKELALIVAEKNQLAKELERKRHLRRKAAQAEISKHQREQKEKERLALLKKKEEQAKEETAAIAKTTERTIPVLVPENVEGAGVVILPYEDDEAGKDLIESSKESGSKPSSLKDPERLKEKKKKKKKRKKYLSGVAFINKPLDSDKLASIGSSVSWSPAKNISFRVSGKIVPEDDNKFTYSWGFGYSDWRPGTWSLQTNHWGPLSPGDGLQFDRANTSLGYKIKSDFLKEHRLGTSLSLGYAHSSQRVSLSATVQRGITDRLYVRTSISHPINQEGDFSYALSFGHSDWRPNTWRYEYHNFGPPFYFSDNNFVDNGSILISYGWVW